MEEYANHDQISIQNDAEDITASPASETQLNQEHSSNKQQLIKDEVKKRINAGFKVSEICKVLNVSTGYVYKVKKEVEIEYNNATPVQAVVNAIAGSAEAPPLDEGLHEKWAREMKAKYLETLYKHHGLVIDTCKAAGVALHVYYRWMKEDPEFSDRVAQIKDTAIDYVESQLFKQIAGNVPQSTIFFLKTRGKDRGYTERHEVTGKDGAPIEIRVIEPFVDPLSDVIEAEVISHG